MNIRIRLYTMLVNRVPDIRERYRQKRGQVHGPGRIAVWGYLIWLNLSYYVCRRRKAGRWNRQVYYEEKKLYFEGSESSAAKREAPADLAKRLAEYDVVSFDVFDTLIFRPFSEPADLFYFVGEKLGYQDFREIRREMEKKARLERYGREKDREVNLEEIYAVTERETGIGKDEGIRAELEEEYRFCFANPYMLRVAEELAGYGKRTIVVSDMYLGEESIRRILKLAGYGEFDACYISCECRHSKQEGGLYEYVKEREGREKRFVHIGDNAFSDVRQGRAHGFAVVYYKNANESGKPFRAEDMSAVTGSIYRGIVNSHLYNGLCVYGFPYEYGFVYGGLFAVGYCQFIHEYVKRNKVEKILFLSRDGAVLSRVYERLYPGECREYVYWSRLAAAKLAAGRYKYDYFRRFLYHKVNRGYTLSEILGSMELEDMLGRLCERRGFAAETKLNDRNVDQVKEFLMENWTEVLSHYEGQIRAGGEYYREVLRGIHKAAAVDIGWAGSGAVLLSYMVNNVWGIDCSVDGLLAGTNSFHNYEKDAGEAQLENGSLASYLFSQKENRDIWKFHDAGKNHNLYWEMLLGAEEGSVKGFYPDGDGKYRIAMKEKNKNGQSVREIHRGILDFTEKYLEVTAGKGLRIGGRDAYAPMLLMEGEQNEAYRKRMEYLMDEVDL